ncbi:MAG TPA: mannose-1-phosphate guanylyltransferase [Limnochordales bacterium]
MGELVAVVMAGGRGERFWPMSRRSRPKQLLALDGEMSLIQQAVQRILPLVGPERVLVVTNREYADQVRAQLDPVPPANILVEPVGRNTAACIGLAAVHLSTRPGPWGDDPIMVVLPADHVVRDAEGFRRVVRAAAEAARRYPLVTIGVWPSRPETGYGYIELGARLENCQGYDVYQVRRFVEKPSQAVARRFVADACHLWNSGMFVWRARAILQAIERHLPELARGLAAIAQSPPAGWEQAVAQVFETLPSISVDYGVLERSDQLVVVPADFGWDDAGSWPALERLFAPDEEGNVVRAERFVGLDTRGCVVFDGGEGARGGRPRLIAALGVRDLVVVQTEDVLLVCAKERAQEIRALLAHLRERGWQEYL